ncbi:bZIP transcription factor1 [Zea mays]|nr:bZIP transcription factor1 [Zea mays]
MLQYTHMLVVSCIHSCP